MTAKLHKADSLLVVLVCLLLSIAAGAMSFALASAFASPPVKQVPVSAVAPEVCTGNGLPRRVTLQSDTYHVVCATGLIQEVQR